MADAQEWYTSEGEGEGIAESARMTAAVMFFRCPLRIR